MEQKRKGSLHSDAKTDIWICLNLWYWLLKKLWLYDLITFKLTTESDENLN